MSPSPRTPVTVPDIGDFADVPIIEILVAEGDTVAPEDPLVTLESDKATMDVPAPSAGVVAKIHVALEDRVSEGALLLELEPAGEVAGAAAAANLEAESEAAPEAVKSGGPAAAGGAAEVSGTPVEASVPGSPAGYGTSAQAGEASGATDLPPVYASPSARRLARELGVEIRALVGSGRLGRVTAEDVRNAQHAPSGAPAGPAGAGPGDGLSLAPWPKVNFEKFGPVERVARTRIQKISAPNLARNWVMIPHVTQHDEADITEMEAWRKQLNSEGREVKFTAICFLIAACVASLKAFPNFNASLDGDELVRKRYYNIGFAADTPNGLVVPVIRDADKKSLTEIAGELTTLSSRARDGKLGPADITGATFTISSLGGIGGRHFTPIINAPEVAILGVSRSSLQPVWDGAGFTPRLMLPLSLSYDHRVIDGAAAARFIVHLGQTLTDLRRALL